MEGLLIMHPEEARRTISAHIAVTRQQVLLAKAYIIKNFDSDTDRMMRNFLRSMDITAPNHVVLAISDDPLAELRRVAESISWWLAAQEAIWGLIHATILLATSEQFVDSLSHVNRTINGTSSSWDFPLLAIRVPRQVMWAPSYQANRPQPLTDPDLYLHELNIPNLHPEIETALREAVACLRHELYTACLAMLGRASEVGWIEMGLALAEALPRNSAGEKEKARVTDLLRNPFNGIGKQVSELLKLYERQDFLNPVSTLCGVKLQDLRSTANWSDLVRDARNSLHYGAAPAMSNSYEKVVALLMGAVSYLRILTSIQVAAKQVARDQVVAVSEQGAVTE